uniref:Uncharacterized protein n=1 Tax=Anopheles atroparvus TaxID=41427 RepID=A0A182IUV9_ANOAO
MEEALNTNVQDGDHIGPEQNASPLTGITISNVRDLSISGLTNLCSRFGRVTLVQKHSTNPNMAFIEYGTESDATMAVQELNSKLGFSYRAEFQIPKQKRPTIKAENPPVKQLDDEDWEKERFRRRFNYTLMPPLLIKFPVREPLGTKTNYLSAEAGPLLRKVDPELFFLLQKVMPDKNAKQHEASKVIKRQKMIYAKLKASGAEGQFRSDRHQYSHSKISDDRLTIFLEDRYCVVCAGLGLFFHCRECYTYYCCVPHMKQHLAQHELVCSDKGASKHIELKHMEPADGGTPLAEATRGGVLTRDPLPNKVKVYITAVLTHNRIFVRSADPAVEAEYMRTLGDCEEAGVFAKPAKETEPITTGEIYLAPGAPHGSYGRVLLIEPGQEESKCVFVEFGTLCFVGNKSLLRIDDPELKYRKVYVYKVCLAGVTDEPGEQEKGVLHLENLKARCLDMHYRMDAGNMVDVQLRTRQGTSVNETINRLIIIPVTTSEHDHNNYIMYKDISQINPTLGERKSILILSRTTVQFDGRVNWIAMDDLPYLETLQEKLQHYGKKVSEFKRFFTPRIGELCLVRCVDRWYRAVCHETVGDCRPEMFLCDYGCMMIFDLMDIRKLPPQLATPVRTHDGIVGGLLEAKAGGLKLDSELLDVYLPENEPLTVDISQETKHDSLVESDEPEVYNILHMPMFSEFTATFVGQRNN